MNDVSDLTGCPLNGQKNRKNNAFFSFSNTFDTQCRASTGTFCFSDSDCVGNGKCGSGNKYSFSSYDPLTNSYSVYPGYFGPGDKDLYFLVSKEDNNGRPKFITYYYKLTDTSWVFYKSTDGGKIFSSKTKTIITFEESPVKDPTFSLTYLGGNNYQLNVEYITEYQDSTKPLKYVKLFGIKIVQKESLIIFQLTIFMILLSEKGQVFISKTTHLIMKSTIFHMKQVTLMQNLILYIY